MTKRTLEHVRWVEKQAQLRSNVRDLLYSLALRANYEGEAVVTYDALAKALGVNKSTVARTVQQAIQSGCVKARRSAPTEATVFTLMVDEEVVTPLQPKPNLGMKPRKVTEKDFNVPPALRKRLRELPRVASTHPLSTGTEVHDDDDLVPKGRGDAQTQPSPRRPRRPSTFTLGGRVFEEDTTDD